MPDTVRHITLEQLAAETLLGQRPPAPPPTPGTIKARALGDDELKALWDSYDGDVTADPAIDGEDVHRVLNERGLGVYCAV